jgi:protoporphyrinogen oxidase
LTLILGAGITGLSVAYHLKEQNKDFIIIEKEEVPGGLCRNININGYTFNYTGHFLHCKSPYVQNLARKLIPDIKTIKRNSYVYLNKRVIPYPIQSNRRYLSPGTRIKSFISYLLRNKKRPENLEEWFICNFGREMYNIFFLPYNEKLWKYSLNEISPDFLRSYVPKNSFGYSEKVDEYNEEFLYPEEGIGALVSSISKGINILHGEVKRIEGNCVYFDEEKIKYENLVSTIPLPEFLKMLILNGDKHRIKKGSLIWNSVLCINVGIKGQLSFSDSVKKFEDDNLGISKFHWMYFPDRKIPFYRIGSLSNVSSRLAPENHSSIWVEISYRQKKPNRNIVDAVIKNLEQIGLFDRKSIVHISQVDIPYAYPIYDMNWKRMTEEIRDFLKKYNIILAGRFGGWKYSYMEESILEGKKVALELCR